MSHSTGNQEGFLRRWSRRKLEADHAEHKDVTQSSKEMVLEEKPATDIHSLTDADMPALDCLDENSDYSCFFSKKVSDELKQAAFRKLFHLPTFNVVDGLDDYDEDFTRPTELLKRLSKDAAKMVGKEETTASKADPETAMSTQREDTATDDEEEGAAASAPEKAIGVVENEELNVARVRTVDREGDEEGREPI